MSHQFSDTGAFNFVDQTATIGQDVKLWHFCVILADVEIGDNVSVGSHAEIGRGSKIGPGTRISSGVFLPSNSTVGSNVFLGPRCCFADDKYPRANNPSYFARPPIIEDEVSVGMNATILPGIRLGKGCTVAAGATVTHDVAPGAHVRGEPSRVKATPRIHHEEHHEVTAQILIDHFKKTGKRVLPS
jgi:acetyltransferase-like isoleucine patch superfamily enzyme